MDKTITVDQLATTDLRSINEIWLGGTHTQLCLWRGDQVFTPEMMSEGSTTIRHMIGAARFPLRNLNFV